MGMDAPFNQSIFTVRWPRHQYHFCPELSHQQSSIIRSPSQRQYTVVFSNPEIPRVTGTRPEPPVGYIRPAIRS